MTKLFTMTLAVALIMGGAYAELQNVEVGGKIELNAVYHTPWSSGTGVDELDNSHSFMEQRTRLNVTADFTDEITAFIEFDDNETWGDGDFRSDYITGTDFRASHADADVEVFQSYIEMREFFGMPVTVKAGRQEILLGDGWLVGPNEAPDTFTGLSFDAITAVYEADTFNVTGIWSKLAENSPAEEDGDVDMYGLYGSYTGFDSLVVDAYWLYVRDGRAVASVPALTGTDDTVNLHTIGVRVAGDYNAFDYVGELAYQFGDADALGYADDDFDAFAVRGEIGYTFDVKYQPRVYLGGHFYEGGDDEPAFNRLFSDFENDAHLDDSSMSNTWLVQGGVTASITEALEAGLDIMYLEVDEEAPGADDDLGWQITLMGTYQYTEDIAFEAGWTHYVIGDAAEDPNLIIGNGTIPAGFNEDDVEYFYFYTSIEF